MRRAGDEGIFQFAVNFRPRDSERRPRDRRKEDGRGGGGWEPDAWPEGMEEHPPGHWGRGGGGGSHCSKTLRSQPVNLPFFQQSRLKESEDQTKRWNKYKFSNLEVKCYAAICNARRGIREEENHVNRVWLYEEKVLGKVIVTTTCFLVLDVLYTLQQRKSSKLTFHTVLLRAIKYKCNSSGFWGTLSAICQRQLRKSNIKSTKYLILYL